MLWVILLILGVCLYCFLSCFLFPRKLFKIKLETNLPKGTGQKVITEVFGTTILYTADKSINKHIHQYILSNRDANTTLLCEIDTSIYYLEYICVCYNSRGKAIKIINVSENIESRGLTSQLDLPSDTAQVSILVNKVNETSYRNSFKLKMGFFSILLYSIIHFVLTFGILFLTKICLGYFMGDVFVESFIGTPLDEGIYTIICLLLIVNLFIIYLSHKTKYVHRGVK